MAEPNLYTSEAYLDAVRRTYCPGRSCVPLEFQVDGRVYRLLATRRWHAGFRMRPAPVPPFLDMHEPIASDANGNSRRTLAWLPRVSHGMVPVEEFVSGGLGASYLAAPTLLWDGFGSWEDYLKFLRARSSLVREDQRRMRRLEETLGSVVFEVDDLRDDVFPTVFAWKSGQMRETLGFDLFANPRHRRFFVELRQSGILRTSTLRAGERLLAAWFGAIHEGRWYGWVFAIDRDPELRKLSIGRLLLYRMLEASHGMGHREFDFSIGDEPYKWFFSTHARLIAPAGRPPLRLRLRRILVAAAKSHPWLEARMRALRRRAATPDSTTRAGQSE